MLLPVLPCQLPKSRRVQLRNEYEYAQPVVYRKMSIDLCLVRAHTGLPVSLPSERILSRQPARFTIFHLHEDVCVCGTRRASAQGFWLLIKIESVSSLFALLRLWMCSFSLLNSRPPQIGHCQRWQTFRHSDKEALV
jgi:hypothetical protein